MLERNLLPQEKRSLFSGHPSASLRNHISCDVCMCQISQSAISRHLCHHHEVHNIVRMNSWSKSETVRSNQKVLGTEKVIGLESIGCVKKLQVINWLGVIFLQSSIPHRYEMPIAGILQIIQFWKETLAIDIIFIVIGSSNLAPLCPKFWHFLAD